MGRHETLIEELRFDLTHRLSFDLVPEAIIGHTLLGFHLRLAL
jgi:hypothetical protein